MLYSTSPWGLNLTCISASIAVHWREKMLAEIVFSQAEIYRHDRWARHGMDQKHGLRHYICLRLFWAWRKDTFSKRTSDTQALVDLSERPLSKNRLKLVTPTTITKNPHCYNVRSRDDDKRTRFKFKVKLNQKAENALVAKNIKKASLRSVIPLQLNQFCCTNFLPLYQVGCHLCVYRCLSLHVYDLIWTAPPQKLRSC